jgi:hypothetical protein
MSQVFVRKGILRGQHVEAVNAFWACTLKPLAELLRMRYCPVRWDFGVRCESWSQSELPNITMEPTRAIMSRRG